MRWAKSESSSRMATGARHTPRQALLAFRLYREHAVRDSLVVECGIQRKVLVHTEKLNAPVRFYSRIKSHKNARFPLIQVDFSEDIAE